MVSLGSGKLEWATSKLEISFCQRNTSYCHFPSRISIKMVISQIVLSGAFRQVRFYSICFLKSMTAGVSRGLILCCLASGQDKASPNMNLCDCSGVSCLWLLTKSFSTKEQSLENVQMCANLFCSFTFFYYLSRLMFYFLMPWINNICEWVWEQMLTVLYLLSGQISFLSVSVCNCFLWRTVGKRKIQWTCCFYAPKLCGLTIVSVRSLFW